MYELRHNLSLVKEIFSGLEFKLDEIDFINEFFIAQTTRKAIDIYITSKNNHILVEVKTDKVGGNALKQVLYYRDLFFQRSWIDLEKDRIKVVLIGKRFSDDLPNSVEKLVKINNGIQLIQYTPINQGKWGKFKNVC